MTTTHAPACTRPGWTVERSDTCWTPPRVCSGRIPFSSSSRRRTIAGVIELRTEAKP